jgi:hypothetical protein
VSGITAVLQYEQTNEWFSLLRLMPYLHESNRRLTRVAGFRAFSGAPGFAGEGPVHRRSSGVGDYFPFRLHRGVLHPRIRTSTGFVDLYRPL